MTAAMLMMIGGCLMMLEPLLRKAPLTPRADGVGPALREAFVAEMYIPPDLREIVQRLN